MNHMWKDGEFGAHCWRCGYTPITKEAQEECAGIFDQERIQALDQIISQATASKELLKLAQAGTLASSKDSP